MNTPQEPLFDEHGLMARQATRRDVEEAARTDAVLHHCLAAHRHGDCTYEEALLTAVVWLSKNRKALLDELTKTYRLTPPGFIHPPEERK